MRIDYQHVDFVFFQRPDNILNDVHVDFDVAFVFLGEDNPHLASAVQE